MYAPKFISWMSDEERFHSALDARIAPMLEAMRAEGKRMLIEAEEILRLRPNQAEMLLQMMYNGVELSTYYNEYQKQYANGWSFK